MALLKTEAEKLSLPDLQAGVIENIITSDDVFALLPFEPMDGKIKLYNRENSLGSAEFYDVSDSLSESAATFTQLSQELKRLIGQVDVDEFLDTTMSDVQSQAAVQIATKSKVVGRTFANAMINGNVAVRAKEFDGMRKISEGLPASQKMLAAAAGAALSYDFLDELLDALKIGDNPVFIMNSRTIRSYVKLQRALGGTTPETVSIGGRVFSAYRGRPILKNDYMPVDESPEGKSYADAADWAATTAYVVGDFVKATSEAQPTLLFECTVAGTSGGTEPSWDTTPGNTTVDSGVTWTTRSATMASIFLTSMDEQEGFTGLVSRAAAGVDVEDVGPLEGKDARRFRVKWYTAVVLKAALALGRVRGVNN